MAKYKLTKTSRYLPHPYLIYVRVPNSRGKNPTGLYATNNQGFGGIKPTYIEKKPGIKRVVCIGGSTTEMVWEKWWNTYPDWLQRFLGEEYEVINAGVSGWTTAEMLINLQLRLLEFKPDIAVIYAGFNDAKGVGIYKGFTPDYSHARCPLGFTPIKGKGLLHNILPEGAERILDEPMPEWAVQTYKRNIRSMLAICEANSITPIVVEMNLKQNNEYPFSIQDGVRRNIEATRNITEHYMKIRDLTDDDFIDGCHFNTVGMQKMARDIGWKIKKLK